MKDSEIAAHAFLENDEIVIKLPIANIQHAFNVGPLGTEWYMTDVNQFLPEFLRALNDDTGDNGSIIERMFDDAMGMAVENGADGVVNIDARHF